MCCCEYGHHGSCHGGVWGPARGRGPGPASRRPTDVLRYTERGEAHTSLVPSVTPPSGKVLSWDHNERRCANRRWIWTCMPTRRLQKTARPLQGDGGAAEIRPALGLFSVTLELVLVLLVQILDPVNVLDGAPRSAGGAPHGVVERLHHLVIGGTGLLRGREACRHSAGAAGRGHGGHRHQLHGLRVQRPFPVEHP